MKKMLAVVVFGVLCLGSFAQAQYAATGTTNLVLTVGPEAAISISTATTNLTTSTSTFANPFIGTTNFTYKIRTTKVGGTGNVTAYVSSDFSNGSSNQPSVANPPTGDSLTYTCTVAAPGTACGSAQTATTVAASATPVASFGADAHATGNTGSVNWSLTNDPLYPTGTYNATVTFTISAT